MKPNIAAAGKAGVAYVFAFLPPDYFPSAFPGNSP
jgi:hypothetical protein